MVKEEKHSRTPRWALTLAYRHVPIKLGSHGALSDEMGKCGGPGAVRAVTGGR